MPAERTRPRAAVRTAVVWEVLRAALADVGRGGDEPLRVLDIGGGTGEFAVPLAESGANVTVVDPSPDSLAALERRAAEAGVGARITGVQGDATDLPRLLGEESADAVVCHSVLELVDDAGEALAAVRAALRPGGIASVLVANRVAATLARVASGRVAEARRLLESGDGTSGAGDPLRRRFTAAELDDLVERAGLTVMSRHGIRIFADAAPPALLDIDPDAMDDLLALEHAASGDPAYVGAASLLHVLAQR